MHNDSCTCYDVFKDSNCPVHAQVVDTQKTESQAEQEDTKTGWHNEMLAD